MLQTHNLNLSCPTVPQTLNSKPQILLYLYIYLYIYIYIYILQVLSPRPQILIYPHKPQALDPKAWIQIYLFYIPQALKVQTLDL